MFVSEVEVNTAANHEVVQGQHLITAAWAEMMARLAGKNTLPVATEEDFGELLGPEAMERMVRLVSSRGSGGVTSIYTQRFNRDF
jgi:hypothetical protein